jgi:hypothetical protein
MPASASNLLVGPGNMHVGDFGALEPLDTAVADALDSGTWPDVGATDGGVTVTAAREYFRLRMDQTVESPGRRLTNLDVTLATNLAEPTLENWNLALADSATDITTGGTGATGYAAMDLGGPDEPGAEPTYKAVIFRGRAPQGRRRLVIVRKALSIEEVESEYKKDDQTFIPVTFGAHWVSTSIKSVHIVDERPSA